MIYYCGVYYKNKHQPLTPSNVQLLKNWALAYKQSQNRLSTYSEQVFCDQGFSAAILSEQPQMNGHKSDSAIVIGEASHQPINQAHKSDTHSDDSETFAAIARALLSGNKSHINQWRGAFSWVVYDTKCHALTLCRDHLGWANLCYFETQEALYFANDIELLCQSPNYLGGVSDKYIAQSLEKLVYFNHLQTAFEGIHYFPPSQIATFTDAFTFHRYWAILKQADFNRVNEEACVAQFEEALIKPLLAQKTPLGLMLSGGCDSSLLAAVLTKNNIPFKAYSYYFNRFCDCNESQYIDQTVRHLQLNHEYVCVDDSLPYDDMDKIIKQQSYETIQFNSFQHLDIALYKAMKHDGITSIVAGHFGDDMFFGGESLFYELLHNKEWLSYVKTSKFNHKYLINHLLHKPHYKYFIKYWLMKLTPQLIESRQKKAFEKSISQEVDDITRHEIEKSMKIPYGTRRHLYHMLKIRQLHAGLCDVRKTLAHRYNFHVNLPYINPEVIEFIWGTLPQMLDRSPNANRYLQRLALKKNGLDFIAKRTDKTSFYPLLKAGIERNHDTIHALYQQSKLAKDGFLTKRSFNMKNPIEAHQFIAVEMWYRQFCHDSDSLS